MVNLDNPSDACNVMEDTFDQQVQSVNRAAGTKRQLNGGYKAGIHDTCILASRLTDSTPRLLQRDDLLNSGRLQTWGKVI